VHCSAQWHLRLCWGAWHGVVMLPCCPGACDAVPPVPVRMRRASGTADTCAAGLHTGCRRQVHLPICTAGRGHQLPASRCRQAMCLWAWRYALGRRSVTAVLSRTVVNGKLWAVVHCSLHLRGGAACPRGTQPWGLLWASAGIRQLRSGCGVLTSCSHRSAHNMQAACHTHRMDMQRSWWPRTVALGVH
jgi:hypothetical protein